MDTSIIKSYSWSVKTNFSIRTYGAAPYRIAAIHGGPGAPGYMAPVARELSKYFGVVEPLQTKNSLDEQIQELHDQLNSIDSGPFILIGSSWGAILALLTAARYPQISNKVILIGSAVFDAESSRKVKSIRRDRTSKERLVEIQKLEREMATVNGIEKNRLLGLIADLELDSDVYDPETRNLELIDTQLEINQNVWRDFVKLRDTDGKLKKVFSSIMSDIVIVHGDHDPHVIEGIHPFLKSCIPNIRLEWLEKCGHYPWIEKYARDRFFDIMVRECQ